MKSESATDPIHPTTLDSMEGDEYEVFLEKLRERRLRAAKIYEEGVQLRKAVKIEKLKVRLDKKLELLRKDMERADKLYDKIDGRVFEVRKLMVEIED